MFAVLNDFLDGIHAVFLDSPGGGRRPNGTGLHAGRFWPVTALLNGPTQLLRARPDLLAQTETGNQLPVAVAVLALQVVEHLAPLADHLE